MTDTVPDKLIEGQRPTAEESASAVSWFSRLASRLGFHEAPTIREVLESALKEEGTGKQVLAPVQREMLLRTLRFGELRIDDVMVPRADIVAIDQEATLLELLALFKQAGHSRIPVYHETLDDLRGMVHIKDLVGWILDQSKAPAPVGAAVPDTTPANLEASDAASALAGLDLSRVDLTTPVTGLRIRRQILFVPGSMPALNLLLRMQSTHIHLAMVVDEYGGTDGLVSIEDLVEQIVGDIEDEHDTAESELIVEDPVLGLVASARAPIAELEQRLGISLVDPDDEEDFDTLGGLVFSLVGRVPVRGELVPHSAGIEFEVLDADPRRIKRLRIHMRPEVGPEAADADGEV